MIRYENALLDTGCVFRETFLDPFALQLERQREHAWRDRYIAFVKTISSAPENYDLSIAEQIAKLPADVRGFGHVKMQSMETAIQSWDELSLSLRK